ncbi:MAG: hypothetical protein ACYDCK_04110 [Thermoplasmatota archaeon]
MRKAILGLAGGACLVSGLGYAFDGDVHLPHTIVFSVAGVALVIAAIVVKDETAVAPQGASDAVAPDSPGIKPP